MHALVIRPTRSQHVLHSSGGLLYALCIRYVCTLYAPSIRAARRQHVMHSVQTRRSLSQILARVGRTPTHWSIFRFLAEFSTRWSCVGYVWPPLYNHAVIIATSLWLACHKLAMSLRWACDCHIFLCPDWLKYNYLICIFGTMQACRKLATSSSHACD